MIAIKRVCEFYECCLFASSESQTCTEVGGYSCGVFRTVSQLEKEKKKKEKR